jgi:hypothetical protein
MKEINIRDILDRKPTNLDRIKLYYRAYTKETDPNKKIRILKLIKNIKERK